MLKLTSIVYSSSAVKRFSVAELMSLLRQSREKNNLLGVTGMLLYKDLDFMQVIEGEEYAVQKLSARIEKDPRHRNYTELRWEIIQKRQFPNWTMGFTNLQNFDMQKTPGYSSFLDEPLTSTSFKTEPSRSQKLLSLFRS